MNDRDYEKEIGNLNKDATKLLELHKKTIKEKQELNNRIMKAIEEINYYDLQAKHLDDDIYLDETLANNLLRILKGEDKK